MLFPTTLVGSYPQPDWLIDREKLAGRFPPRIRARELWRIPEPYLQQAQDDATRVAIRAQEEAGLDIITDGEIRRESYSNRIATALERPAEGLDYLEMFLTGVIDAALAAQNGAAAAESLGLGMVYIGGMRNRPEEVAELLGLPPGVFAVFGMCVGRPDPARPADIKPRPPQAVVLHHERYALEAQDAGIAAYDRAMERFYAEQKMNVHGTWSVHSSKRIAGPETLSGRHRLVEALNALGFALK